MTDTPPANPFEALKPCPFCGDLPCIAYYPTGPIKGRRISCNCGCVVSVALEKTEAEAIAAWNRRATYAATPSPDVAGLVERMRRAHKWATAENDLIEPELVSEAADALTAISARVAELERERRNDLELTGSRDTEDLRDMAMVGHSLLDAIASVTGEGQSYAGWTPAQDPAEIVNDLINDLDEATAAREKAERERDEALDLDQWTVASHNRAVQRIWEIIGGTDTTREGGQNLAGRIQELVAGREKAEREADVFCKSNGELTKEVLTLRERLDVAPKPRRLIPGEVCEMCGHEEMPAAGAEPVVIKTLKWSDDEPERVGGNVRREGDAMVYWTIDGSLYRLKERLKTDRAPYSCTIWYGNHVVSSHGDFKAAKAAAQQDFERRILSALEAPDA